MMKNIKITHDVSPCLYLFLKYQQKKLFTGVDIHNKGSICVYIYYSLIKSESTVW